MSGHLVALDRDGTSSPKNARVSLSVPTFLVGKSRDERAPFLAHCDVAPRPASISTHSLGGTAGGWDQFHRSSVLLYQVLRFLRTGPRVSPRPIRTNRDLQVGTSLVLEGDVLIHGPFLVAWPVGSEWRIHRLHHSQLSEPLTRGITK
jgi:hypothetical protein